MREYQLKGLTCEGGMLEKHLNNFNPFCFVNETCSKVLVKKKKQRRIDIPCFQSLMLEKE